MATRTNGSRRVVTECGGQSRTEQHHANEVNINAIVSRYQKTGVLPTVDRLPGYGDFSEVRDYHAACDQVRAAEAAFMMLPSGIRKRFRNDVGELLRFLDDDRNREEAVALGIVEARVAQAPQPPSPEPMEGSDASPEGQTPEG